jgi:hypothetical protein
VPRTAPKSSARSASSSTLCCSSSPFTYAIIPVCRDPDRPLQRCHTDSGTHGAWTSASAPRPCSAHLLAPEPVIVGVSPAEVVHIVDSVLRTPGDSVVRTVLVAPYRCLATLARLMTEVQFLRGGRFVGLRSCGLFVVIGGSRRVPDRRTTVQRRVKRGVQALNRFGVGPLLVCERSR